MTSERQKGERRRKVEGGKGEGEGEVMTRRRKRRGGENL